MPRTTGRKWRQRTDPLWRGDAAAGVTVPVPGADRSIVRHVLFLDGAGRDTPYHSTSEDRETAEHFGAGPGGRVYETSVPAATSRGVGHVSRNELLQLLRGKGHGDAAWHSAVEVLQARKYVEQWSEHLLGFCDLPEGTDLQALVRELYR